MNTVYVQQEMVLHNMGADEREEAEQRKNVRGEMIAEREAFSRELEQF